VDPSGGGVSPIWGETQSREVVLNMQQCRSLLGRPLRSIKVQLWNENSFTPDEFIGSCEIKLPRSTVNGGYNKNEGSRGNEGSKGNEGEEGKEGKTAPCPRLRMMNKPKYHAVDSGGFVQCRISLRDASSGQIIGLDGNEQLQEGMDFDSEDDVLYHSASEADSISGGDSSGSDDDGDHDDNRV
jgi:hypothetical protein